MNRTQASPTIDRMLDWSISHPIPPAGRVALATLVVAGSAAVRVLLITNLLPWLIFMPVVLLIGLMLGRAIGLYAVVLSAAFAAETIAMPGSPYWLTGAQWGASLLFIVIASIQVFLASELRASLLRARVLLSEREEMNLQLVRKEEQAHLLNQELGHRLKNLLTIVQAVAGQTLRQSSDLASAGEALAFRLAAIGRATDVLTASSWDAAGIEQLARSSLDIHNAAADRFRLAGPSLRFNPQIALALALAFHELSTNAVKYGALSTEQGHVDLNWSIVPGSNGTEPRWHLRWKEVGGPPVRQPERRGFGSLMIERLLRSYLNGAASISYEPDGLLFCIDAPLAGAIAE
jgi:two-component sensor histidine kinase